MGNLVIGLIKSIVTKKLLVALFVSIGDEIVKATDNKVDDAVWEPVKDALKEV